MSDYPLCLEDDSRKCVLPKSHHPEGGSREPLDFGAEEVSEHVFDWDSAALVAPGGLSPALLLAMQRQQERLSSVSPRKTDLAGE